MKSDAVIRHEGFKAVFEKLDIVEAERFIALIKRDSFDYTQWRKDLWEDLTVEELSKKAMKHYNQKKNK